jgi:hypothetical protein
MSHTETKNERLNIRTIKTRVHIWKDKLPQNISEGTVLQ